MQFHPELPPGADPIDRGFGGSDAIDDGAEGLHGRHVRTAANAWLFWALLSACFAALTAVFAKIGVANTNSDFATFIRTVVIIIVLAAILVATGQWQSPGSLPRRTLLFLVLSGLATGASWICYFRALKLGEAARVAPIDKLSVVLVAIFGVLFLREKLSPLNVTGVGLIAIGAILVAVSA